MTKNSPVQVAVLCVDDEPVVTESLRSLFSQTLKNVEIIEIAHSAEEAMEVIEEFIEDGVDLQVVISDYIMPGVKGDQLLVDIHKKFPKAKKIMLTGQSDITGVKKAINKAHLYRFLEKPWINDDMLLTIRGAITAYEQETLLDRQNRELIQLNQALEQKVMERTRELEKKNRELEQIAIIDQLTGLFNRRKLDEMLSRELIRSRRYGNSFGLIMVDIDFFKTVNDTHGHQIGDQVLQRFADQLKQGVREVDVLGRWGGEEFLIICPETIKDYLILLAEKLRIAVQSIAVPGVGEKTASFGVTVYEKGDNLDTLVDKVDKALYLAKEKGRNRVESMVAGKEG
ncbi:signal transduction family protein (GGDEF domain protein) [Desulforapulum autotrophicum HRM2]|uniref:diguanylate cyclase n=1 Tax=Desulforapulum autotrophicum (strain ATCC 43914 / DSM 3382 / VKM B-1955 / HRM2) TaxID=177437 RepID=C0QEH9_DESAH|nr:diguanylate cyclase [Desulforapulum autotrophicum]ACN15321.1 signal transduction family protein (GGDEF domain protein) [Desulforapulum autotrophicum HRM2]